MLFLICAILLLSSLFPSPLHKSSSRNEYLTSCSPACQFLAFEFGMVCLQKGFFGFRPWIVQWFSTSTLCISNNGYYKPGGILHSSTLLCDTVPSEVRSNSIQPRSIRASFASLDNRCSVPLYKIKKKWFKSKIS